MTSQLTAIEAPTGFDEALVAMREAASGRVLLSQDRCVDGLLDLYNAAPTDVVRQLIADVIDQIRHLSAVRATDIEAELDELAAAASVESAFFS